MFAYLILRLMITLFLNNHKDIFQHLRDGGGAQYPLQVTADSPHVTLGAQGLHPPSAETSGHEETDQNSQQRVRNISAVCVL